MPERYFFQTDAPETVKSAAEGVMAMREHLLKATGGKAYNTEEVPKEDQRKRFALVRDDPEFFLPHVMAEHKRLTLPNNLLPKKQFEDFERREKEYKKRGAR